MTKPNRPCARTMMVAAALAVAAVSLPQPAHARDKEFGVLVHYVESHYHVHRQYRFLMGVASLAVDIAHPYGVKGMKLAIWENQKLAAAKDDDDFPAVIRAGLAEDWKPMIQVWSHRTGERTVIFAKPDGKEMKLLVATVDSEDAVVVQVKINPDKLSQHIDEWTHQDRYCPHGEKNGAKPPTPIAPNSGAAEIAEGM